MPAALIFMPQCMAHRQDSRTRAVATDAVTALGRSRRSGGGGNWTPVRRWFTSASTCVAWWF